ncbi:HAD-IB family hydrolase [Streptomyces sp. NPDC058812]|uniref:HAD-IB family hydrolase n=1 Tax=unclassified Streptomyces TaxID=2593676 RepID=UPI0036A26937
MTGLARLPGLGTLTPAGHPRGDADRLLSAVAAAPQGPETGAYFDFDGTLIRGHSALAFCRNRLRHGEWPAEAWRALTSAPPARIVSDLLRARSGVENHAAARLGAAAAAHWHGKPAEALSELSERVFAEEIVPRISRDAWMLVRAHQAQGHTVAIATAASRPQAEPLARALGVDLLCTPVEVTDGRIDTRRPAPLCAGTAKLAAVRAHATEHGAHLSQSFAYCDGYEDLPLLENVGRPRAVNPKEALAKVAHAMGWPVVRLEPPRGGQAAALVATSGAVGAALTALTASAFAGAAAWDRHTAAATALRLGSDLVLRAAGVRVRVTGRDHLRARRPAVFVANHSSPVDALILAHLLRSDWCAMVKRELGDVWGLGHFLRWTGALFVDRNDRDQSAAVLASAVERLRRDVSVLVEPEGTRAGTPDLGPFRTGAFRVAARAAVPVVPVVIRNATDVMDRDGRLLRPGRVDVAVLPPVETADWAEEDIRHHADRVRESFAATLRNWPERDEPAAGDRPGR